MTKITRTLLISWQRPDGRYAGAEVLRKIVRELPRDSIRWAYLAVPMAGAIPEGLPEHRAFPCRALSWRFRWNPVSYWLAHNAQSPWIARRIADWAAPFRPQRIWVMAELGAVNVAYRLSRRLGVPVHATVHDSYSFARFAMPRRYYPVYRRNVARLMARVRSMDAVSEELLADVQGSFAMPRLAATTVMRPSISRRHMMTARTSDRSDDRRRTLGLCGSVRIGAEQWARFLEWLGGMPFEFTLLLFTERSAFFDVPLPPNVTVRRREYAATEEEVVNMFNAERVDACYLGLTRRPEQREFAARSLSSKLTTYAAAAAPVIVHGPRESVAWRLVEKYDAGVLCDEDRPGAPEALRRLFTDDELRVRKAAGAERLCREEFELERNATRFAAFLSDPRGKEGL